MSRTYLQNGPLRGGLIVAPFLYIALVPSFTAGLVERLNGREGDVCFISREGNHFCQVVHKGIIASFGQVVSTSHIPTAAVNSKQMNTA